MKVLKRFWFAIRFIVLLLVCVIILLYAWIAWIFTGKKHGGELIDRVFNYIETMEKSYEA